MNFVITFEELNQFRVDHALTVAETRILADLCNGLTIKEIARKRECSVNTIKTHIKALFLKTATHKQQDLIIKTFQYHLSGGFLIKE